MILCSIFLIFVVYKVGATIKSRKNKRKLQKQKMTQNGYDGSDVADHKPAYALEHLATFKVKSEAEIRNPKEKMKVLIDLDKSGGIWPQKMFMCFSGQWLLMLDSEMKEIENFPGSMITEPTAFISEDPLESFNNILIFTVPGVSLGNTEMHIFQVTDVSAVHLVEDLKILATGKIITNDRNKSPIKLPKQERPVQNARDQYGIAGAVDVTPDNNDENRKQIEQDIQVLNHCFEDIERFVARLQYAAEAMRELELRQNEHNTRGEGLLVLRSRPPIESEFQDILAKHKLALNYSIKLQNHFTKVIEPIQNMFISLHTVVDVCNNIYEGHKIPENIINPLLKRETVVFLNTALDTADMDFWYALGPNWTLPKDQFKDHKGSYHPIFYDDWSPDWVVDEDVAYLPPTPKKSPVVAVSPRNNAWLMRLESRNVKIAEALYSKTGSNDKELHVIKGEYLEIIDDSRNWWRARNALGNVGYVPHTILKPNNFDPQSNYSKDTDSLNSIVMEHENTANRNSVAAFIAPVQRDSLPTQVPASKAVVITVSEVPVPPPMPPVGGFPTTPTDTMKRNMMAAGTMAAMRARNDYEPDDDALLLQDTMNDELKYALTQREKRKDLEILKTAEIYINQKSTPKEVENWLRGKGFSNKIVTKLGGLNGEELFALSTHIIESYFGREESRRLISQIVLQKNICEYKTIRSSELSAKLAKARQKAEHADDEVF